ncbi:MAG: HAD family phosphatase [Verrucomicrobia bacterium]|nr:HAD family phosphatase [Verrucomicrobiota bacterium]
MQWIKNFDLFLFDMDGLLVNTEELHYQAYKEMLRRRGYDLSWDLMRYFQAAHIGEGNIAEHLYREFPELRDFEWGTLYAEKRAILSDSLKKGALQLMPGVEPLLKALSENKIESCVVTHSRALDVELIRSQLPVLQLIPHWLTREDYEHPKPHPAGYLKAKSLFLRPEGRVIGFEDTYRGLNALLGACVDVPVLICDPQHPQLKEPLSDRARHFNSFSVMDLN